MNTFWARKPLFLWWQLASPLLLSGCLLGNCNKLEFPFAICLQHFCKSFTSKAAYLWSHPNESMMDLDGNLCESNLCYLSVLSSRLRCCSRRWRCSCWRRRWCGACGPSSEARTPTTSRSDSGWVHAIFLHWLWLRHIVISLCSCISVNDWFQMHVVLK